MASIGSNYGAVGDRQATNLLPSPGSTTDAVAQTKSLLNTYNSEFDTSEIKLPNLARKPTLAEVVSEKMSGPHARTKCLGWTILLTGLVGFMMWGNDDGESSAASSSLPRRFPSSHSGSRAPFSTLDPVVDLGLYNYHRPNSSQPPEPLTRGMPDAGAYPTNSWYQNLLMPHGEPDKLHRSYTIPYVVDATGVVPGLRLLPNHVEASSFVVQLNIIEAYGLTVGAAVDALELAKKPEKGSLSKQYKVTHTTPLGVTLEWDSFPMHSSITKGMPYATMRYESIRIKDSHGSSVIPTVGSELSLAKPPVIDGDTTMKCYATDAKNVLVSDEIELHFLSSDFSWLVFFSEPVWVQCSIDKSGGVKLQVVNWNTESETERDLVIRIALYKLCTSGTNPIYCHQEKLHPTALMMGQGTYGTLLRKHANYFPGKHTAFDYAFDDVTTATMVFDWDVHDMSEIALHPTERNATAQADMIAFALPHQFDIIQQFPPADTDIYCAASLIGPTCLYEGGKWYLKEPIPEITFRAPRPPAAWAVGDIAESLQDDLDFTLPELYQRGAGDTYFSGKMLGKLGRILLIAEELIDLCGTVNTLTYPLYDHACQNISLPSERKISKAVNTLKSSVEIWINGTAETPFVFDAAWGGVASCGCLFSDKTKSCENKFPECSAFDMPGLNFGNGFYNDMHFHYGYFIYSAAVVARFDPKWGRRMFEEVVLLIRCIANPSKDDMSFPEWRHKDWFQGHSWASGIAMEYSNGKNQESSSEAISAYEAVALYGRTMTKAWKEEGSAKQTGVSEAIEEAGQLLAATELRSARKYYHVQRDETIKIYPVSYTPMAIGIMWQTMAQLQTFFGSAQYLAYGIQLLPITPISEQRDSLPWAKAMYHKFASSCSQDPGCVTNGWSVLQLAVLATVGHQRMAADIAIALPADVFESAGGDGHSLSNTLWYLSSRADVGSPLPLSNAEKANAANQTNKTHESGSSKKVNEVSDCGKPTTCTAYVLDTIAGLYSCRQRMDWLIQQRAKTEKEACIQVAGIENPYECGPCNPQATDDDAPPQAPRCAQCTLKQCQSDLNRCPLNLNSFVCTDGPSTGGCSTIPWEVPTQQCHDCCELTHCPKISPAEKRASDEEYCPLCSSEVCKSLLNQCSREALQYLCLEGGSKGGCSALPWHIGRQCEKCCKTLPGCED